MKTNHIYFLIVTFLVSMVTISSCTSDDEKAITEHSNSKEQLQVSLDSLNQSIRHRISGIWSRGSGCNCHKCNGACNCCSNGQCNSGHQQVDTINVVLQDAFGALVGAEAGSFLGGSAGTVTIPIIGTVAGSALGGLLGGIIGGVASSWQAANDLQVSIGGLTNVTPTFDEMKACVNRLLSVDTVILRTHALTQNYPDSLFNMHTSYKFASMHNSVLDELFLNQPPFQVGVFNYDTIVPSYLIDPLEDAYIEMIKENKFDIKSMVADNSDNVLYLTFDYFNQIFKEGATTEEEARDIINSYLSYVYHSTSYTTDEKKILIFVFFVCWHSYLYWM